MSGITTGVGVFSGIDTRSIIDQLLAVEARPRQQAQNRILQLQTQQASYLDINTRLIALRTASSAFRTNSTFQSKAVATSNENVLTATASNTAVPGNYQFIVDRLVSSQQNLSRGFATRDQTGVGATSITVESAQARLDRDVALADLNDGAGVRRGKMTVTDSAGRVGTVDLGRATTVQEVLDAINGNGTAAVTASVSGGRFVIRDNAGGTTSVADAVGSNVAADLGLTGVASSGGTITGRNVFRLGTNTSLSSLNDGRGVSIRNIVGTGAFTFTLNIDGTSPANVRVNLGEVWETVDGTLTRTRGQAATTGEVVTRINDALQAAGVTTVSARINADAGRLEIIESTGDQSVTITENGGTAAADLGLTVPPDGGSILGKRVFAGLNTTLVNGINGGSGLSGNGVLNFTARDGATFSTTISRDASLSEIAAQIEQASRGSGGTGPQRLRVALNTDGTGLEISDLTGATTSNLIITGATGADSAASLGISTGATGVASASVRGTNLQRAYISGATTVASLNQGRGIGTGTFRIIDSESRSAVIDIGSDSKTLDDIMREVNAAGLRVTARINTNGDGLELIESGSGAAGPGKIRIEDVSGSVARNLNIAGEAAGVGAQNRINGTFERTIQLSAADSLDTVVSKINAAKAGVSASAIRDGTGATPFRLSLASNASGVNGRVIISAQGTDLGLTTLDRGNDSRAFFGSTDPARALVVGGSTNTLDDVLTGVRIDLKGVSETPVNLSVTGDTAAIESSVNLFVSAFNTLVERIDFQSRFDPNGTRRQPLTGDATVRELRAQLFQTVTAPSRNTTGAFSRLTDVGLSVGSGGKLSLDTERLREALAQDPASVEALFTARQEQDDTTITLAPGITARNPNAGNSFSSLGVTGLIEQLANRYLDTNDGILTGRSTALTTQITQQNQRIAAFNTRLDARRAVLERQFLAMERTIGSLQSQQSALGSIQAAG
jgi:flagellar hook-associated protein 2